MHNYEWAANKIKLAQAVSALKEAQAFDSNIKLDEETIKAEYVKRAGLLVGEGESTPAKPARRGRAPKATADEDDKDTEDDEDEE